ncbi:MAG: uroporphyrinogen decarboxylase family protein, partial [Kiritimatiellae bacterium]|nr:uroporphyrinogen decarboxylase family protein [Kiritimatiellia bacterium]
PFSISVHSTLAKYGEPLLRILRDTGCDFYDVNDLKIPDAAVMNKSSDVDAWGCRWDYALAGIHGIISYSPLADWNNFKTYKMPAVPKVTVEDIENAERMREKYPVWAGVDLFYINMQNLRGTENMLMDFYTQPEEVQKLIDRMLNEYHLPAIEEQLKLKPDILGLADDWGTQTALLINPSLWRQFMKPVYKQMIDLSHQGRAKAWLHGCGHTRAILPEWIDLGLDVINPQICCMDVAEYGEVARGKITIMPDLDRQHVLVGGSPDDVRRHIRDVYAKLGTAQGGLIGYAPLELDMPLENIKAMLETVSTYERKMPQSKR